MKTVEYIKSGKEFVCATDSTFMWVVVRADGKDKYIKMAPDKQGVYRASTIAKAFEAMAKELRA